MKILKPLLLSLLLIVFITNIDIVIKSTKDSSILFFNKIFISIFPFILLSDILIYYDYHIFLKNTLGKFLSKIFNINPNSTIVFILSLLTAQPSNAIYIKQMIDNNELGINDANKIIKYTYFPSISFVIGTIGITLFKSFKIGLILYLNCLFYNTLIGIFTRKELNDNKTYQKENKIKKDLNTILKESTLKGINISSIILGNLILFTIIINLINKYLKINNIILVIITGLLEMTNGIINIQTLQISLTNKILLTSFILNFSGLSVFFQSTSILNEIKLNKKRILIIRLIFSIITTFLLYIILKF